MIHRSLISNNFWWKITSVVLATIVWITFHNEVRLDGRSLPGIDALLNRRTLVRNKDLPITLMRAADDTRSFLLEPPVVDIVVSGDQARVGRAVQEELTVFVDLSRAGEEPFRARVQVSLPAGVKLEKITPDEVHVELVKRPVAR